MNSNSIWITGAEGRLGRALVKLLKQHTEYKVVATDKDVEISDIKAVEQAVEIYRPTVIINCASISDEEFCENNMVEAYKVNALGARNIAAAGRRVNAKIIQLSTDDVFEGNGEGVFTEFDAPQPISVYGKSKLAGENYVRELNTKHLIIRSSWVYSLSENNFFSEVVECGKNGKEIEVMSNHISTPTCADTLAAFIVELIDKAEYGVIHASAEGKCSRAEFARTILENMGYDASLVKEINNGNVVSTHLENLMLKMTDIYKMPDWKADLIEYTNKIKEEC